jgi:hypothetical protein
MYNEIGERVYSLKYTLFFPVIELSKDGENSK